MPLVNRRRSAPTSPPITGPADTLYVGVDEAGYGPNLGPLVVTSTSFRGPACLDSVDWWKLLEATVGRARRSKGKVVIDDSKAVLASPSGRATLEHSVDSMLRLVSWSGGSLESLVSFLAPSDRDSLCDEHWFKEDGDDNGPASHSQNGCDHERLNEEMAFASLSLDIPLVRLIFPRQFNERLAHVTTKADVESELILDILSKRLERIEDECQQVVITVDRLGGRRYYRELVESLARDTFVFTLVEGSELSAYRFEFQGRDVEIRFRVKGDSHSLPVAAASMIAKYLRERCMDGFNDFWCQRVPGLSRTAGYPVDARRFLEAVAEALAEFEIPMNSFWRLR